MSKKSLKVWSILILAGLVSFTATAFAADAVAGTDSSILDLLKPVYNALSGGHYAYAGALLVILMVALVKRYLGDKVTWLHSDAGGSAMALLAAAATASATALAAPGAVLSLGMLKAALLVGVGAAGGYAVLKNLLVIPILIPLQAKAPAWAKPIFSLVLWIFDKPDAIKQAEAAGAAAVAAAPGAGATAVVGIPTEIK